MNKSTPIDLLLVEDDPNDLELAMRAFRKANLVNQIHVARDGAEALGYFFDESDQRQDIPLPKVVLLDLKLPKVDGLEVLRRLKADSRTKMIPVVVLTSSTEQRDLVESYQLGVNSYIVKPVNFDRFVSAVSELGFYWLLLNQPAPAHD